MRSAATSCCENRAVLSTGIGVPQLQLCCCSWRAIPSTVSEGTLQWCCYYELYPHEQRRERKIHYLLAHPLRRPLPLTRSRAMSGSSPFVVAVVCPAGVPALAQLPSIDGVEFIVANTLTDFQASPSLPSTQALMFIATGGDAALMSPLLEACPEVKWCHSLFAGVDTLAPFIAEKLASSDVPLTNGKGAFSDSLAEYVLAAALHFNKKVPELLANRAAKNWDKFVMPTLAGKTMGFVGFGHIGQTTAAVAKAFGMNIMALRRHPAKAGEGGLADVTLGPADKLRLFEESDFVVSVLPGTPETANFCGTAEFAAMKESAVFISVGRGMVVDEDALAEALSTKSIAGAALDVFKVEPLPEASALWQQENLLLTAHNADYTDDYFALGWKIWRDNYDAVAAGTPLPTLVDTATGY